MSVQGGSSGVLEDPSNVYLYTTPEGTPVYGRSPTVQPQGDAVQRFGKGAWDYSLGGFFQLLKAAGSLASQGFTRPGLPPDPNSAAGQMLQGLIESHADQYQKAKDALSQGNYVEAFGHSLATALPLIGPMSAHIGETFGGTEPVFDKYGNVVVPGQAPDIAQGLGQMFGLGLSELTPRVAPKLVPNLGFESKLPPVQQQAIDYLKQEGVPLTAGQQTGSKFLRGTEQSVGHMPIGAQYAEEFGTGQAEAIKGLSSRLAEQAYPTPVSKYDAGQEAALALGGEIGNLNDQETAAYDRAWQDKDNPEFAKDVQVGLERKPMIDATGKPTGTMQNVPITESVQMPVDVRWVKQIARQELPKLETLPAATQAQRAAVSIFRSALNGPDHITAEMGEEWLKGFKGELRTPKGKAVNPDLLDYSQGQSARIIPRLQQAVDTAVAETGDEAVEALRNGRALHAQKMDVADLADDLRKEPVQAFGQMTMAKDAGYDYLAKIASKAPDIMPRLGRAWLDNVFDLASREGDWRKAQTILNNWNDLGNKTKALMFPEPALRQSLERFFLGQKMTGIQLNPSGTALVTATQKAMTNPLGWVQGYLGGKLLYTPRGIQLLLKSAENPPTTPAAAAALKSEARKTLGPPEEPPEGPPTGGGPAGGGPPAPTGGNLADTLQGQADAAIRRMRDRGTFSGTQSNALFPAEDLADMAIWGAAKMAKGVTQLGAWSKEMLADAGSSADRLKPQLPKLYIMAQKTLERHIANTAGNLPSTQKMLSMYRQGIEGQDWYRNTKAELQSVFGPDTDRFVDFLAATSPNTTVAANTSLALKAYMQWKTGKPFTGYLPETIKSLNKAAAGEEFGGLKVQSFRKNLHGDPVPVTVDRWIARALGFGDQPTVPQYKFMDYLISQVAAKKGLEPRQLQAAIWKTIKDTEGLAGQGGESYEVLVRRKLLSDPDLAAAIQQVAPQR